MHKSYRNSRFSSTFSCLIYLLFCILLFPSSVLSQETITITTYYPSPYGAYDELAVNRLATDITGVATAAEFAAMAVGDTHIGRSLIVGSGATFSYTAGTDIAGGAYIQTEMGIATNNPGVYGGLQVELDVNGEIAANDVWIKNRSQWVGSVPWCQALGYTDNSGTTNCTAPYVYSWGPRVVGSTLPTSGQFLCCD